MSASAQIVIRERVDLAEQAGIRDVDIFSPDSAARGGAYCDSRPYALQIDYLGALNDGGGIVVDGYERIVATELCGFDPDWLVLVRASASPVYPYLSLPSVGVVDADEGSVEAPASYVVMTQEQLRTLGVFLIGRPSSATAAPVTTQQPFQLLFTPVVPDPQGDFTDVAQPIGWSTWVEPYRLESYEAQGRQGEDASISIVHPVGVFSGGWSRFHPLSNVMATARLEGGAADVGGICTVPWGEETACSGSVTATVPAANLFYGTPQRFVDRNPDTPSVLDDPPALFLKYPLDGPKDSTLAAYPAIVGDLVFDIGRDGTTTEVRQPVTVGGYDYRLTFADGTTESEVAYGDSVAVILRPVYADGTALSLPAGFLVDRMLSGGGYVSTRGGPPRHTRPPAAEPPARLTGDGHTDPFPASSWLLPPGETAPWCGSEPARRPIRLSLAGASVSPDSLGPWVGDSYECDAAAYDVPYGRAGAGEVWLVADRVEPSGSQPLVAYLSAQTDFSVSFRSALTEAYSNTLALTILPGENVVRLIHQNDIRVSDGYVMVSKVRPDWLLPEETPFDSPAGQTEFQNDGLADLGVHFDRDTYRSEVSGVPDSLRTADALSRYRFRYQVVRGDRVMQTSDLRSGAGEVAGIVSQRTLATAISEGDVVRSLQHVRLVSNGRPASGAASGCSAWPPAETGTPAPSGACQYDDDVAGEQTILVKLEDTLRVTVYVERADGAPADTLGRIELPVGQPATASGPDAVRRVELVWHEYVQRDGTQFVSHPATAAARMSEDWAQAAIYFESLGPATPFSTADLRTVVEVEARAPAPVAGTISLEVAPITGSPAQVVVNYDAGDTGYQIALKVAERLSSFAGGRAWYYRGDRLGTIGYAVVNQALVDSVQVLSVSDPGNVDAFRRLHPLEFTRAGSEAASAAAWIVADLDRTTADVLVVPRIAIQQGDSASRTLAYALADGEPRLFVTPEVAVGDDNEAPHVLSHEVGHLLLVGDFPGSGGGPECSADQAGTHHPASYNLMFCLALARGESVGGPKRLTRFQQRETRNESTGASGSGTGLLKGP